MQKLPLNLRRVSCERNNLIVEAYRDWVPPRKVSKVIQTLLECAPDNYLLDLKAVVLTNASSLPREQRRRKTLGGTPIKKSGGLYYRATKKENARIEIFVDNLLRGWPKWTTRSTFLLSLAIAEVFFHEVAHHRHFIIKATHLGQERNEDFEKFAERVGTDLWTKFFVQKYWYIFKPVHFLIRLFTMVSRYIRSRIN